MKDMVNFILEQTCASVCCIDQDNKPYCFSCFYALNEEEMVLYFKSSKDAHHSGLLMNNSSVAGTILPDKLKTVLVQGIQFEGEILNEDDPLMKHASSVYHRKHPMALAIPGHTWGIRIDHIKMTDSSKGFGFKINWQRETVTT